MKYYLIAGEASGDLHGANLMKGLLESDPQAEFRFWGGDRMAEVGGKENLARHYKTTSFFGLVEVLKNVKTIFSQLAECKRDLDEFNPDVLILIDYPGFNFRMAKYAHGRGYKTFYYISPKVWAWKESRVKSIRKYVTQLFIIFPFEIEYFSQRGIKTIYEGNPSVDSIHDRLVSIPSERVFREQHGLDERPIIALLAGSRKTEIKNNLPFMVELSKRYEGYQFVVAGVNWIDVALYDKELTGTGVRFVTDATYELLKYSVAAVVTSGTATLETALIGTPQVVCYKADGLSVAIGHLLVKIRFISLVNIVMDREVVKELIQWNMTMEKASAELDAILPGGSKREKMLADYVELSEKMGAPGASKRFAKRMVALLK